MLGILSGECKPVDKSLCVRPFVLVWCLGVDFASGFQGDCLALHTECLWGRRTRWATSRGGRYDFMSPMGPCRQKIVASTLRCCVQSMHPTRCHIIATLNLVALQFCRFDFRTRQDDCRQPTRHNYGCGASWYAPIEVVWKHSLRRGHPETLWVCVHTFSDGFLMTI